MVSSQTYTVNINHAWKKSNVAMMRKKKKKKWIVRTAVSWCGLWFLYKKMETKTWEEGGGPMNNQLLTC